MTDDQSKKNPWVCNVPLTITTTISQCSSANGCLTNAEMSNIGRINLAHAEGRQCQRGECVLCTLEGKQVAAWDENRTLGWKSWRCLVFPGKSGTLSSPTCHIATWLEQSSSAKIGLRLPQIRTFGKISTCASPARSRQGWTRGWPGCSIFTDSPVFRSWSLPTWLLARFLLPPPWTSPPTRFA